MGDRTPATRAAQGGGAGDEPTGAIVPPIHPSTTFERDTDGGYSRGRAYARADNPSYDPAELLLADLEGGAAALLFPSGNAAASSVFASLLPGDHVVAPRIMYWGLRKWISEFALSWGIDVSYVDTTDLDALAGAVRPGQTRVVWVETPANPTWDVTDIAAAADIAHRGFARLVVDSTVATPVLTRPIDHGADLVIHSASKYLNGHSDVLAGAVVSAIEDPFTERIRAWRRDGGAIMGAFEAWLLLRGMRTLYVRVRESCRSAQIVAEHLAERPGVEVLYPGLPDHPGHATAGRQMSGGYGGMLSLRVAGGLEAAMAVAANLEVITRATSLGGVESLVEHRASIEGPSTPVPDDLLRLSIGIEDPNDLLADLDHALDAAGVGSGTVRSFLPGEPENEHAQLDQLLGSRIRASVIARGGDIRVHSIQGTAAVLEVAGSPGASLPLRRGIEEEILRSLAWCTEVRFVAPDTNPDPDRDRNDPDTAGDRLSPDTAGDRLSPDTAGDRLSPDTAGDRLSPDSRAGPMSIVTEVIESEINPLVAEHGGTISVISVDDGAIRLRFDDRCRGCAMAEVTLREGVEPILRDQLTGRVDFAAVVDVTDHGTATDPYYPPRKR